MSDFFARLGEERRPWLDPEALKTNFLALSATVHPDRFHGQAVAEREEAGRHYSDVNTAYQALREARSRVLHLLELERGQKPRDIQRIPPGTMDLFVEIGQCCRDADAFLARRQETTSPMLKVALFRQGLDWAAKLQALQARVQERSRTLEEELQALNPVWAAAPPPGDAGRSSVLPLERLEDLYRALCYVTRWQAQIQERMVQLAGG